MTLFATFDKYLLPLKFYVGIVCEIFGDVKAVERTLWQILMRYRRDERTSTRGERLDFTSVGFSRPARPAACRRLTEIPAGNPKSARGPTEGRKESTIRVETQRDQPHLRLFYSTDFATIAAEMIDRTLPFWTLFTERNSPKKLIPFLVAITLKLFRDIVDLSSWEICKTY